MNKLFLLLHNLIFCLSLLLNMTLVSFTTKKARKQSFCSRIKIYVLMISTLVFVFKIIRAIIFSTVKKISFHSQENFTWSRNFHSQGVFPWSKNLSTVKEVFLDQRIFPQSRRISRIKEFFHRNILLDQENFLQTTKFSIKKFYLIKVILHKQGSFPQISFFLDQGRFPQTRLLHSQRSKRFSKS